MHMEDGVGRDGYRMLAWVIAGIGVVGLGSVWYAFGPGGGLFDWLGLALVSAAIIGLVAIVMVVLNRVRPGPAPPASVTAPEPVPAPAVPASPAPAAPAPKPVLAPSPRPAAPRPAGRTAPVEGPKVEVMQRIGPPVARRTLPGGAGGQFEYKDAQPAARAAPTRLIVPSAFKNDGRPPTPPGAANADPARDPRDWPERGGPSGVTLGEMQDRAARQLSVGPPTQMAKIWYPQSTVPRGWSKGQCGDCGTTLMAPPARPLQLRCPHCDKVTLMPARAG